MILKAETGDVPETNGEVFRTLGDEEMLDDDLAHRLSQAAGFRNVLAHQYGNDIDDRDVYNVLQEELPVFREFLEEVRRRLD